MTKRHITISCIAIAALVTAFAIISRCSVDYVQEKDTRLRLNDTLTNAMSEIPELEKMDARIRKFMTRWHIKGASLAITRNDSLLYAKGYGWADEEKGILMEPGHILRMASVSKLLTAADQAAERC